MQTIGRYQIRAELGRGGMATVFRAYDPHFEREVAVKILPREFLHDQTFRARFEREAKTIAALEHPAIVPVYDYGQQEGTPYLVMRYMDGGSLAGRIHQGPLPLAEAARMVERLAPALDEAHALGIVHRDIKPANILFDKRGLAYLSDFGIVKLSEATAHLTGTGIVGTPAYMAPEIADVGGMSPLIDVYALGVTLYQMLTGRLPFEADTPSGVLMAHVVKPIPDVRALRPDLPEGVQAVIELVMAKDPLYRYQSAGELAGELVAVTAHAPLEAETLADTVSEEMAFETIPASLEEEPESEMISFDTIPTPAEEMELDEVTVDTIPTPPEEIEPEAFYPETLPAALEPELQQTVEQADVIPPAELVQPPAVIAPPRPAVRRRTPTWMWAGVGVIGVALLVGVVLLLLNVIPGTSAVTTPLRPAFAFSGEGRDKLIPLTSHTADDVGPAYSPDGRKLAFASNRDGDFEIYVLDSDGQVTQLTSNDANDVFPAYSPDGRKLAFASDRDGDFEIYVLDSDGQVTQLTFNDADDLFPAYSPSGGKLAFASNRDGDFEIYVLGSDGQVTQLTSNNADDRFPAYSPDGRKLAFASNRDGDNEIYVLGSDGQVTQLTFNNFADDLDPVYSPRGSELAFASNRDGDFEIYLLDSQGQLIQLTRNTVDDRAPATSLLSAKLVLISLLSGNYDLYVLEPASE